MVRQRRQHLGPSLKSGRLGGAEVQLTALGHGERVDDGVVFVREGARTALKTAVCVRRVTNGLDSQPGRVRSRILSETTRRIATDDWHRHPSGTAVGRPILW